MAGHGRPVRGSGGLSRAGTQIRGAGGRFAPSSDWFKVDIQGPLFDARGPKALHNAQLAMSEKIATAAQRHLLTAGVGHFRYEKKPPTYWFAHNVEVERVRDQHFVHADRVIYGPWLEGTSSRNRTTRFKGYRLFRKAAQATERALSRILNPEERKLLRDLEGAGFTSGGALAGRVGPTRSAAGIR